MGQMALHVGAMNFKNIIYFALHTGRRGHRRLHSVSIEMQRHARIIVGSRRPTLVVLSVIYCADG